MDKEMLILKKLEKIQLNNEIVQLEENLIRIDTTNKQLNIKLKEKIAELIKSNTILTREKSILENKVNRLATENHNLQNIINKTPKFLLKIFVGRKYIKLLNEENTYE